MKSKYIIGALFVIFGFAIAVGPQTIFPVCGIRESESSSAAGMRQNSMSSDGAESSDIMGMGDSHMKCWYTGKWEITVGSIIFLLGLLLIFLKNNKAGIGLLAAAFVSGVFVLLIPTVLVGVCGNIHMDCHVLTLPALIIFSGATILTSLVGLLVSFKRLRR